MLTGAARGIGRATAVALARKGFRLGLMDLEPEGLESLSEELRLGGAVVWTHPADVRDATSIKKAVSTLEREVGPTDVLVACAGVGRLSSALDLDLDGLRQMFEVNVLGVAQSIGAVLPGMFERGSGHILGVASVAGYRGMPWMPGYSASKAAIATYLEGLRPSLKRRGVSITTAYPGFVRTGMTVETPFRDPVPMLEPEAAAEHLVYAVVSRPRDYVFPRSAAFGMGLIRKLPNFWYDRLMDYAGPRALTSEF